MAFTREADIGSVGSGPVGDYRTSTTRPGTFAKHPTSTELGRATATKTAACDKLFHRIWHLVSPSGEIASRSAHPTSPRRALWRTLFARTTDSALNSIKVDNIKIDLVQPGILGADAKISSLEDGSKKRRSKKRRRDSETQPLNRQKRRRDSETEPLLVGYQSRGACAGESCRCCSVSSDSRSVARSILVWLKCTTLLIDHAKVNRLTSVLCAASGLSHSFLLVQSSRCQTFHTMCRCPICLDSAEGTPQPDSQHS